MHNEYMQTLHSEWHVVFLTNYLFFNCGKITCLFSTSLSCACSIMTVLPPVEVGKKSCPKLTFVLVLYLFFMFGHLKPVKIRIIKRSWIWLTVCFFSFFGGGGVGGSWTLPINHYFILSNPIYNGFYSKTSNRTPWDGLDCRKTRRKKR